MTTHVTDTSREAVEAEVQPASRPASSAWHAGWIGLAVVGAMAVVVFWVFDALPFMDLPAHAGLIAMRHRFSETAFESRFFVLAPHIGPYSLFRFLGEVFVRVAGPV